MGVTLGRGVIKGGVLPGQWGTTVDMGESIADKVDTFVGIAGANYGLQLCQYMSAIATCNAENGFYPGFYEGDTAYSAYLKALNDNTQKEGDYAFAIFSTWDDLIGGGDLVFGRYTSEFPTQDSSKMYEDYNYGHIALRDMTVEDQFNYVTYHQLTPPIPVYMQKAT